MLALYLIEILHQTTTLPVASSPAVWLYLIEILHQTTTKVNIIYICGSCILSKFYIKPQPHKATSGGQDVVSYRNSTSNHNKEGGQLFGSGVVSYRNSTSNHNYNRAAVKNGRVVSYRNSTSNHNLYETFSL